MGCHFSPSNEWLELLLSRGLTADAPVNPDNPAEESTLNFLLARRTGWIPLACCSISAPIRLHDQSKRRRAPF